MSMSEVTEYQKSAALMAADIELLFTCAENNPDMAFEFFKKLKGMRDNVVNDKKIRDRRYNAMASVFAAVDAGLVQNEKIA